MKKKAVKKKPIVFEYSWCKPKEVVEDAPLSYTAAILTAATKYKEACIKEKSAIEDRRQYEAALLATVSNGFATLSVTPK